MLSESDFRSPLAHTRRASGGLLRERSDVLLDAAGNLLSKALERLANGQDATALKLVERAVGLPYDDFEEVHSAIYWLELGMYMRLDEQVTDAEEDDSRWLARAETLLPEITGPVSGMARVALNSLLVEYQFRHDQERRLRRLIGDASALPGPISGPRAADELAEVVLAGLRALIRQSQLYRRDLEAEITVQKAETKRLQAEIAELEADG